MSFFNFFNKKPIKEEKCLVTNEGLTGNSKKAESIASPVVKVTAQIISSGADDIIPVEKRIKKAKISKHGLYPHEILILDYADSYFTEGNSFQGFWWYKYGVRDVDNCLRSLFEGIIELVKLHKELQNNLIGLIRSFKTDQVGAWICSGWDKCIVDQEPKEQLSNYYNLLSESGNQIVKMTLKTMKR